MSLMSTFYLQMSLYFCLLHQSLDLDWHVHRFDRYKIESAPLLLPADKMLFEVFHLDLFFLYPVIFIHPTRQLFVRRFLFSVKPPKK